MSGGAFNYAYYKIQEDLSGLKQTIEEVVTWVKKNNIHPEAVQLVETLHAILTTAYNQSVALEGLLHAIEWQASGDSCEIDKELKVLFEKYPALRNLPNGR